MKSSLSCAYALGGINFKNGYATSCPQQTDVLHNLKESSYLPSEFFNSPNFKKHRLDLLRGKWPTGCDMCQHVEEQGAGQSMRQELPADFTYVNENTGEVDLKGLKTVEIRFSHSCNMACLHCSEVFSSNWTNILNNYEPDQKDYDYNLIQLTRKFHRKSDDDDFTISISKKQAIDIAEDLNKNFPNLQRVDFTGGEVLYQKQFLPTLEKLSEHPNAKNIKIMFYTNFNIRNINFENLYYALKKFHKSSIHLSIDSGTNIYPYFRSGDWELLKNNIQELQSYIDKKTDNIDINCVCTTSVYQMMDIENIVESLLSLKCKEINFSIVYTPAYLNPALIRLHFEDQLKLDLEKVRKIIKKEYKYREENFEKCKKYLSYIKGMWVDLVTLEKSLQNLELYIYNNSIESTNWDSFKEYTKKVKKIWQKDFNDFFEKYKLEDDQMIRIENVQE